MINSDQREILIINKRYDWKGHLFDYEKQKDMYGLVKFVLYKSNGGWYMKMASF